MKATNPIVILGGLLLVGAAIVAVTEITRKPPPTSTTLVLEGPAGTDTHVTVQKDQADRAALLAALADLDQRDKQWSDSITLASRTARMSLSPVIADMQRQLRENGALQFPPCMAQAQPYYLEAQQLAVDNFLAFMADADAMPDLDRIARARRNYQMVYDSCRSP